MKGISGKEVHMACLHGAKQVMENRQQLDRINVFPVQDGDTGSNLASMMRTIMRDSEEKESVKETFESISDAALRGARGNSGIIFAQYLSGLSIEVGDAAVLTPRQYAKASDNAVKYAYDAIEDPVEGTIITVMKAWGQALMEVIDINSDFLQSMSAAYVSLEEALKQTQFQLKDLRKAGVVDSGAKGFVYFVKGMLDYFRDGASDEVMDVEDVTFDEDFEVLHDHDGVITHRYCTEGFIEGQGMDLEAIRTELGELGDSMVIAGNGRKCRVHIHTDLPEKVFEVLYNHGSITYQKADDMVRQQNVVTGRKTNIAIVTDSIADLPKDYIDDHQIHQIHMNILFRDISFIDKLTVTPEKILAYSANDPKLPTSSQPDPKHIQNVLEYLSGYYDSIIVLTVSSALSGTYSGVSKEAQKLKDRGYNISVINTKQNSGAQGLLVKKAMELVEQGFSHEAVVKHINEVIPSSKILVRVKNLDNMVKSGRLSTRAGKIGRVIGLKPIVTLDENGDGALATIAISDQGSLKKLKSMIRKLIKTEEIESYNIVHIDNPAEAEVFAQVFTEVIGKEPAYVTTTSSIVAVGAGKGAVAISYILK